MYYLLFFSQNLEIGSLKSMQPKFTGIGNIETDVATSHYCSRVRSGKLKLVYRKPSLPTLGALVLDFNDALSNKHVINNMILSNLEIHVYIGITCMQKKSLF